MASKYLSGTYAAGYTLSGAYSTVTIRSTAFIGGAGVVGGTTASYAIVNLGQIAAAMAGAAGINLHASGTITNGSLLDTAALIIGAVGTNGTYTQVGGSGGTGINLSSGGGVSNSGTIAGGYGGSGGPASAVGGVGGTGIGLSGGGSIDNSGVIRGGSGGIGGDYGYHGDGGAGGAGIKLSGGGTISNTGTIAGGRGHTPAV